LQPVFSIIVPTHNRPNELGNCLRALTRQRFPRHQFEVIVIDDGGTLPAGTMEQAFSDKLELQVIAQPQSGPATARNRGAQNAQGKYLAFTDDDCEPSESWLESAEQCLRVHPGCVVGGRVVNALTTNPNAAASQLLIDFLYTFYTRNGIPRFFVSSNFALPREAFREIGGFDESFSLPAAEDREFCARWAQSGGRMLYSPDVVVHHAHALTTIGFLRQHYGYGRGAWHFHDLCRARDWEGARLQPPSFYFAMLRYPLRNACHGTAERFRHCVLFLASQAANAAGFFREFITARRSEVEPMDKRLSSNS
jgi:glycosyltransferase involved in cell wall biosynthesis